MFKKTIRTERFTFLCTPLERQLLYAIADYLGRSQGDTVRRLIRAAGQELEVAQQTQDEVFQMSEGLHQSHVIPAISNENQEV